MLMRQLVELRPDIIGLQEIDLRIDQGNWLCRRFNDLLGYRWGDDLTYEPGSGDRQYRMYHMANPRDRVAIEALGIMTHLQVSMHEGLDYLFRNRVAHRVRVEMEGASLDFYNTHFHHEQDQQGNEVRWQQAERLVRWMGSHGWDVPKVLVGDFNSPPGSRPVRIIKELLASAHETAHGKEPEMTLPTPLYPAEAWPADWPRFVTVDYVFVSPALRLAEVGVVFDKPDESDPTLYPSDHFGLTGVIDLGLSKKLAGGIEEGPAGSLRPSLFGGS